VTLEFTDDAARFREMLMKIVPVAPPKHFPPASFYAADQYTKNPGSEIAILRDPSMPEVLTMQTLVTLDCFPGMTADTAVNVARDTFRAVFHEGTSAAANAFRVLNNLVRLLGSMPGDRVMILVSPGIYLNDELQRALSESIDRATRSGVIINTVDARGVYAVDTVDPVPGCRLTNPQVLQEATKFDSFSNMSQGLTLGDLAHSTGGTALAQNDFLSEFNRLASPPEYVYYLGFYPKDLKPDGKYHEMKVTLVNGKGLSVQTRKGYWAPSHAEDANATATREIGEAVFARDELRDLPIDIHTQLYKTSADDAKVKVTTHLDIRQLPLRKQDDRNIDDVTLVRPVRPQRQLRQRDPEGGGATVEGRESRSAPQPRHHREQRSRRKDRRLYDSRGGARLWGPPNGHLQWHGGDSIKLRRSVLPIFLPVWRSDTTRGEAAPASSANCTTAVGVAEGVKVRCEVNPCRETRS
jgi:VWFA-related protein